MKSLAPDAVKERCGSSLEREPAAVGEFDAKNPRPVGDAERVAEICIHGLQRSEINQNSTSYVLRGPPIRRHRRQLAHLEVTHSKHTLIQMRNNARTAVGICLHPNRLIMNGSIRMRSSIMRLHHFLVTPYRVP